LAEVGAEGEASAEIEEVGVALSLAVDLEIEVEEGGPLVVVVEGEVVQEEDLDSGEEPKCWLNLTIDSRECIS